MNKCSRSLRASRLRKWLYPAYALLALLDDSPSLAQVRWDHLYEVEDPWDYLSQAERRRHHRAIELIDLARPHSGFGRALEVGCAEGVFTRLLAPRSRSLMAADISPRALARARRQCATFSNIEFVQMNLRRDPLPGKFDLIVAMDVLYYIRRPWELRALRDKLVDSLRPGGLLLVEHGNDTELDSAWWSGLFCVGPDSIERLFERHPALRLVERSREENCLFGLLQKKS